MLDSNDLTDFMNMAQSNLESLRGGSVVIAGVSYPAFVGPNTLAQKIVEGGFIEIRTQVVRIRKNVLAVCPAIGTLAASSGANWRIARNNADAIDPAWTLHLESPDTAA